MTFYLPHWLWGRYYRSAIWRYRRRKAIKRAGGRCERCGDGERLEVHHKTYARFGRELASDLRRFYAKCDDLHAKNAGCSE